MTVKDAQSPSPMVIVYTNTKSKNDTSAVVMSTLSKSAIEPTFAEQIASWTKKLLGEHELASSNAKKNIKVREEAKLNRVKLAEMLEEFGTSQHPRASVAKKIFVMSKWFIDNDQDFSINYTRLDD